MSSCFSLVKEWSNCRATKMKFIIILLELLVNVHANVELPTWNMKPLGSHTSPQPVDESFADNLISPRDFAKNYVLPRKPIVFRNVVKEWPAFKLWSDEYLKEKYGDMEVRLEGKKEKRGSIPVGDVCLGRDRLKTFLNEYKQGVDKYVVSELPTPMWKDVLIPASMSCGEFLTNFVEIDFWINSDTGKKGNGGNSLLHKDAFNTVNCVLSGKKEWKLIELKYNDNVYQSWEGPMDRGYGGFSLINPDKVDAERFPKVGEIPWQFTTVNAGDCIHLPSQMWHQVKSYGEVNRAVAFLFSKFQDKKELNMSNCPTDNPKPVALSEVDVDLQYPGTGEMSMGHNELSSVMEDLKQDLLDKKKGYVTKKRVFTIVYLSHGAGVGNKDILKEKTIKMYTYLLSLANGLKTNMNQSFVDGLTRAQVRPAYSWMFPTEPANSYEHEYGYFSPEELGAEVENLMENNNGKLTKDQFMTKYIAIGGSEKFAIEFWSKLAGDRKEVSDISETIDKALEKYEYYRRGEVDEGDDEDNVNITPQGHESRPKRERFEYDPEEGNAEEIKTNMKEEL